MKPPAFLVFDLDGTLIDGYTAIGEALAYAMEKLGERPLPNVRVRTMVGHGLEKLVADAVGPERAEEGVRLFRERYPQVAVEGSHLLPGVAETLAELAGRGHRMAVASNKPAKFSRLILEAKGVASRFEGVGGPDGETPPKPDPTMLRRLMQDVGVSAAETIAIGDMEVDFDFARAAGCRVILIPSGSRTLGEISGLPADGFLDVFADLPAWLAKT